MDLALNYLQGFIETMGLIVLSLVFSRVKIKWRKPLVVASVLTIIVMGIRSLPLVFGIHFVITILIIYVFIFKLTEANKSVVFISVFASILCLGAIEYSLNQLFISLNLLYPEDVTQASSIWLMMGYIQAVLLNIIAVVLQIFLKPVHDWKDNNGT